MKDELKKRIKSLAEKYETKTFLEKDPSQFMHRYEKIVDREIVAFISANLAFGRREQILSHVESILSDTKNSPSEWILKGHYKSFFSKGDACFYRMFSHNDLLLFCDGLKSILEKSDDGTLGCYIKKIYEAQTNKENIIMANLIARLFPSACRLVPHSKSSACKKMNMMLRWLVRTNSPVDMGLWTWFDRKNLLMPLDTHVMQEATRFGLISPSSSGKTCSASYKKAVELTEVMKEVFPDDPVRGDFALFGLGVDENIHKNT